MHVTAINFVNMKGIDAKVPVGRELAFGLCNASWKEVEMKKAKIDEYGTASVDFELPKEGQTGMYHVSVNDQVNRFFRVEEYKRPTFEITFPKVNEKYTWGDTVVVKASATP